MFLHRLGKVHAPEFATGLQWLNSKPMTMRDLRGKVVLLDFWTYSCVNCLRTQPHLNAWYKTYKDRPFVMIGVHTPEFAFEKDPENVKRALKDLGISYPVVLDPDYKVWNAYANRWWPRKFLVDHKGVIVHDHVGEGGYAETEQAIQKALMAIGEKDFPAVEPDEEIGGGVCYRTTPELYLGFLRGRFGNAQDFIPKEEQAFTDAKEHTDDIAYLHGHWKIDGEYVEHTRSSAGAQEYLALKYSAFSANCVMSSNTGKGIKVIVELDGQPLPEDMAGADITYVKGEAHMTVNESRMYRIVDADTYHRGLLRLRVASAGLQMYAFTFGGCKGM